MLKVKLSARCKAELIEALQVAIVHYRKDIERGVLDPKEVENTIRQLEIALAEIEPIETKGP